MKAQAVYDKITAQMIKELEGGKVPWLSPWNSAKARKDVIPVGDDVWPRNAISRHMYRGANVFVCWLHQTAIGAEGQPRLFLTFKQAKERGGSVRKGEHGCTVIGWGSGTTIKETDDGELKSKRWMAPFGYHVFHISQCDGVELPKHRAQEPPAGLDDDERWQVFLKATKADVKHGGDRAFYNVMMDYIGMPSARHFTTPNHYKAVALHELGHWTGAQKRLGRKFGLHKGDHDYAFEELVAELSSAFLCARLGIVQKELRHAEYLRMYLQVLKFDNKAIVNAASKASAAAEYIMDLATPALKEHHNGKRKRTRSPVAKAKRAGKKAKAKAKPTKTNTSRKARRHGTCRAAVAHDTVGA